MLNFKAALHHAIFTGYNKYTCQTRDSRLERIYTALTLIAEQKVLTE